jgi:RHS repeat-associated protein
VLSRDPLVQQFTQQHYHLNEQASSYDANGNLQTGGGRSYAWNADNQPSSITGSDNVQEDYAYDADGTRVSRTRGNVTTIYLGGLVEQEGTTTRTHYVFGGQVIAQREGSTVIYLHGDHLGSISVATSATGAVVSKQEFTPWGEVRSGGIGQTTLNYTGQRKDGTGLLYYGARYYDPGLARFVSADSIVPDVADGKGGSAATLGYDEDVELRPLTVDFHEPAFASIVGDENAFTLERGFWFQINDDDRQEAKYQWGPRSPQALNRYSYTFNNPVRYTDPSGHCPACAAATTGFFVCGPVCAIVAGAIILVGTAYVAGEIGKALAERDKRIVAIQVSRQKQDRHVRGTPEHARAEQERAQSGKKHGSFGDRATADKYVEEAWNKGSNPDPRQADRTRQHDFGHNIPGAQDENGQPTSKVRVHRDNNDRIHGYPVAK